MDGTEKFGGTRKKDNPDVAVISVSSSPHLKDMSLTSHKMMLDVIIALLPVIFVSIYFFKWFAVKQMAVCLVSVLAAEALFTKIRQKDFSLFDLSALITGLILGLSLPGPAPWYVGVVASFVAIGIGKTIFGGLGMNIFNPAMVGRAFVMIAFPGIMAAAGYESARTGVDVLSMATPLDAFKQSGVVPPLSDLFWGLTNGSPGEVSAIACIAGGIYLCLRRTAAWEIPFGIILAVAVLGLICDLTGAASGWTFLHHLAGGALLFGAFFIATDPVTSPISPKGRFIFGLGTGAIVMLLRVFSGYPEGVMFAVLLMNALTPLLNMVTIPKTLGEKIFN